MYMYNPKFKYINYSVFLISNICVETYIKK